MDFEGRRIVVTGGSKGIGAAIVSDLCERGADVLAVARGAEALEALRERTGCDVLAADVRDTDAIVSAAGDSVFGLVNNAGINIRKSVAETTHEDLRTLLAINLEPMFLLSQGLHGALVAGGGSIVNLSSVASSRVVSTSTPTYAASKGGVDALTRFLAVSWGREGVRVNGVAPWYVRTPLANQVLRDPAKRASILERTPMGRVGEPREVAAAVRFLLSSDASWITGVILPVDGGFSALGS